MTRKDLVGFLRSYYSSGCTVIAAAGKVSHRQVLRAVRRFQDHFLTGSRNNFSPVRIDQQEPRVHLFTKETEQTQLALGIRTCSRHDERRYALRLLNAILGENMSSRLFQVVREDRGLAYTIYSSPSFFEDTGDLVISAGLDTDNLARSLRLIMRELRRLIEAAPTRAELRRARDYVIGQIELGQESAENQMNWIGEQLLGYGRIHRPSQIKRRLSQVTGAEVQSVARELFRTERFNLALVSPLKSDRVLRKLIRI
jgi:predicted Zn-dependent peptidase